MKTQTTYAALLMFGVLAISALPGYAGGAGESPSRLRIVPTDGAVTPSTGLYVYDPSGNVAAIGGSSYVYDPMGRLVTAAVDRFGNVQSQTYTYDIYGNRTSDGVTSYSANVNTNRLTSQGAQYDAAGNLTRWQPPSTTTPRIYSYDALNTVMMEKVTVTGGEEYTAHIYTADDERYWSFRGGVSNVGSSRYTLRDLEGRVLREFSEPTANDWSARDYLYRDGLLLASHDTRTGDTHHYSLDHLGTPRVVTNQDAAKVAEHTYFPFGAEYTDDSPTDGGLHFTGHEQRDSDLLGENRGELDYMHARYYSASFARFLSKDPVFGSPAEPQSWNGYSYVTNRPLTFTDPRGLCGESESFIGPTQPCDFGFAMYTEVTAQEYPTGGAGGGAHAPHADRASVHTGGRHHPSYFDVQHCVEGTLAPLVVGGGAMVAGVATMMTGGVVMQTGIVSLGPSYLTSSILVAGGAATVAGGAYLTVTGASIYSNTINNWFDTQLPSASDTFPDYFPQYPARGSNPCVH